jgi:hypothetical protein
MAATMPRISTTPKMEASVQTFVEETPYKRLASARPNSKPAPTPRKSPLPSVTPRCFNARPTI